MSFLEGYIFQWIYWSPWEILIIRLTDLPGEDAASGAAPLAPHVQRVFLPPLGPKAMEDVEVTRIKKGAPFMDYGINHSNSSKIMGLLWDDYMKYGLWLWIILGKFDHDLTVLPKPGIIDLF